MDPFAGTARIPFESPDSGSLEHNHRTEYNVFVKTSIPAEGSSFPDYDTTGSAKDTPSERPSNESPVRHGWRISLCQKRPL
jgi:hypothetical protein